MHEGERVQTRHLLRHVAGNDGYPVIAINDTPVDQMPCHILVLVGVHYRQVGDGPLLWQGRHPGEDDVVARARARLWKGSSSLAERSANEVKSAMRRNHLGRGTGSIVQIRRKSINLPRREAIFGPYCLVKLNRNGGRCFSFPPFLASGALINLGS